jgi:hypothetical protein
VRVTILLVGLVFTALLGALTAQDFGRYGVTAPGIAGAVIVVLLAVALVGALLHPPRK